jgi:hypothetical protein
MWLFHLASLDKVTPKCLWLVVIGGVCYSTKLEKLQLDAARIVTGLPIFTKTNKLYSETGLTTLSSRRHNRKLST